MRTTLLLFLGLSLAACSTSLPEGVQPVTDFNLNRYLGKWYEIARLDHSFERGLQKVTAIYTLRNQGGINVENKGYSTSKKRWQKAEGKAYLARKRNEGYLKVSFFGPFYSSYVIFNLDKENYEYAFVAGNNKSYLWLMSRSPTVSKQVLQKFITQAKSLGFNTDKLIYVQHE